MAVLTERALTFADHFSDPYDVETSYQLSGRLIRGEPLQLIDRIRDADAALKSRRYREFMRLIKPVLAPVSSKQQRQLLARIVYNDLYLRPLEPSVFALPAREQQGRFVLHDEPSLHRELDVNFLKIQKDIASECRRKFHSLYGLDLSQTVYSVRHVRAVHGGASESTEADPRFRDANENYLHLDQKKGVTTIVYLSDVSVANGAFRYVEGSHLAKTSPILKALHEFTYSDLQILSPDGLAQFPPEFRSGINYYYWLEPEKKKVIDSLTRTLTGPAGTAITFAGNAMLHGGGVPYTGERSALFIQHFGRVRQRLRQALHPVAILQRM